MRRLAGLSIAHLLVDGFASFPAPLFSMLAISLGVNYRSVSMLGGLSMTAAAAGNILLGLTADRRKHLAPYIITASTVLTVICMSALGVIPGLGLLAAVMMLGAFTCGAFHPPGFSTAGDACHPDRHHGVSIVMAVGLAACGLGPIIISAVVSTGGLGATPLLIAPGLGLAAVAALLLGKMRGSPPAPQEQESGTAHPAAGNGNSHIALLFVNATLRAYAHVGVVLVVSYLVEREWGLTVAVSGLTLGALQAGAGLGGLAGARLTRIVGERLTMLICAPVAMLVLLPMTRVTGAAWVASLFLFGFALNGPGAVTIALAQRIKPARTALVSGLLVGPVYAIGAALASVTTPLLISTVGQATTMAVLAVPLAASGLAAYFLPGRGSRRQ